MSVIRQLFDFSCASKFGSLDTKSKRTCNIVDKIMLDYFSLNMKYIKNYVTILVYFLYFAIAYHLKY